MKKVALVLCVLIFVLVSCGSPDLPPPEGGTPLTVEVVSSAAHFNAKTDYPVTRLFSAYDTLQVFVSTENARYLSDGDYRVALYGVTHDLDETWFESHDLLQIVLADKDGASFELTALYGFPNGKGAAQVARIAPEEKSGERAVSLWVTLEKGVFTAASDVTVTVS